MGGDSNITRLLQQWTDGDRAALDGLVPLVYEELRSLAHRRLRTERSDHTLNTTALVHEAYVRLVDIDRIQWRDRAHFLAMASRTMRRVLVDYANARNALKRGGDLQIVPLDGEPSVPAAFAAAVIDLDDALTRLEEASPRAASVIEHRYFGGLTLEETAAVLDVSLATVKRDLALARAWLARELSGETLIREPDLNQP